MNRLRFCIKILAETRPFNYEARRQYKRWVAPTQIQITKRKRELPPQPEPKRSTFLDWNRDSELYAFAKRLNEDFNTELLEQAFTHRSYIIQEEQKQKELGIEDPKLDIIDNRNLIEKGGELTSEIIRRYLTKSLPRLSESGILVIHDYLMSTEILAKASSLIGTKDIILTAEYPPTKETLGHTFLALVAALAESTDVNRVTNFVRDFLLTALASKDLTEIWCPNDPLEALNDLLTKEMRAPAEPRLISQTGKNSFLSSYQIAVYSNKEFLGAGFGQSIQEAKDVAALNALARIYGLTESSRPLKFNTNIDMS